MIANRTAYVNALMDMAKTDRRIMVVDVDVANSLGTVPFRQAYPEQFVEVGIAEQNMIGVATGLSACGKIPFAGTFGVFTSLRAIEQIRNSVCYTGFNVKAVGSHSGLETGLDGGTHQTIEDISVLRSLPNMKVLVPSTPNQTYKLTKLAAYTDGPVYIRLGKDPQEEFYSEDEDFAWGGSKELRSGNYTTVIACGRTLEIAIEAADMLKAQGKDIRVIDMYSIKPIDKEAIIRAAKETRGIITIEDHTVLGGLGGAVSEVVCENAPAKVLRLGLQDMFGRSGHMKSLYELYGITSAKIIEAVNSL